MSIFHFPKYFWLFLGILLKKRHYDLKAFNFFKENIKSVTELFLKNKIWGEKDLGTFFCQYINVDKC
jgi:hypothetical protein